MRNIIKSILLVGTLSTSLVVMADTKPTKPDVTKKAGSGSATAGSGSAAGSAAGSGSAHAPAAGSGSGSAAKKPATK